MRRVRLVGKAGVAGAMLVLTAGCLTGGQSDNDESEAGKEKLTGPVEVVSFYPKGAPDYQRLQRLASVFEQRYSGSKVELVFGGGQDTPKIQARWRAGNPPEVNFGFFDGTSPTGREYAEAGQVYSLDDVLDDELAGYDGMSWRDAILPAVHPFLVNPSDDKYYAVPESVTTIQFFYNEKIFEQHGITPPETLDDLIAAADQLKNAGIAPFAVTGTFPGYMQMYYDYLLMRHADIDEIRAAIDGTRDFSSIPGVSEAAEDLEQLVNSGYFMEGFEGTDFTNAQLNFFQGKTAMILMGSWLLGEMKDSIPAGFEVGTFPFPTVPDGQGDQEGAFGTVNTLCVAAQSQNPALGAAWLKFLSERENQVDMSDELGYISAYRDVPPPEGFADQASLLETEGSFAQSYLGLYSPGTPPEIAEAVQLPIQRLFFGELDAAQMVAAIDNALRAAAAS